MAKKGEYNYFEILAESKKKSRGNWVFNLPEGDALVVKPFTVKKALKAKTDISLVDQLKYAMGEDQWDRLYALIEDEDADVLQAIAQNFSDHFFGDAEDVPGGK